MFAACGPEHEDRRTYSSDSQELRELKETVLKLQGTIAMINAFTAKDFSNCDNALPPFEKKVCDIAQTAVAEGQLDFFSSIAAVLKVYQDSLFGVDCPSAAAPGCPALGSISANVSSLQASSTGYATAISDLQADVLTLQSDLASLNTRLDDFDGSGSSIEVVVQGINTDIVNLENRVDDLESVVASGDVWRTIKVCGDNFDSGPLYEAMLFSGDKTEVVAYVQTGTQHGLGMIAYLGAGDQYLVTAFNTRACKFKIYDLGTELKMCWKNDNRSATTGQIDTACNAPSFAAPLSTCTCK